MERHDQLKPLATPVQEEVSIRLPRLHEPVLHCPSCDHPVQGEDFISEKQMARCGNCHHVFGFSYQSRTGQLQAEQLIPDGVEILKLKSEVDIRLRWKDTASKGGHGFLTVFALMWNLFVLPIATMAVVSGNWAILLFLSLHISVGLGLAGYLIAKRINQTSISITDRRILVRTFPLRFPFQRNIEISADELEQLYVSKYTQSKTNGVPNYAYALYAILKNGKKKSLLRGMNKETQAYIETEAERFLGIRNKSVDGEYR